MLTQDSHCDFAPEEKAEFYDADSHQVASKKHKDKLLNPVQINPAKQNDA